MPEERSEARDTATASLLLSLLPSLTLSLSSSLYQGSDTGSTAAAIKGDVINFILETWFAFALASDFASSVCAGTHVQVSPSLFLATDRVHPLATSRPPFLLALHALCCLHRDGLHAIKTAREQGNRSDQPGKRWSATETPAFWAVGGVSLSGCCCCAVFYMNTSDMATKA